MHPSTYPTYTYTNTQIHKQTGNTEDFINGLRVFDKDGTGFMPTAELRHVLTSLGEKLTSRQVDQLVAGVPTDGDGNINYDAFIRKMMTPMATESN